MSETRCAFPIVPIAQPRSALAQVELPASDAARRDAVRRTSR